MLLAMISGCVTVNQNQPDNQEQQDALPQNNNLGNQQNNEPTCPESALNEFQCEGDILLQKYRNSNCSVVTREFKKCDLGCDNGACVEEEIVETPQAKFELSATSGTVPFRVTATGFCPFSLCIIDWGDNEIRYTNQGNFTLTYIYYNPGNFGATLLSSFDNPLFEKTKMTVLPRQDTSIDLCAGISCPDKCNGATLQTNGYCSEGQCYYSGAINGATQCGQPPVDLCAGIVCNSFCDGTTYKYDGVCVSGICNYSSIIPAAQNCASNSTFTCSQLGGEICSQTQACSGKYVYSPGEEQSRYTAFASDSARCCDLQGGTLVGGCVSGDLTITGPVTATIIGNSYTLNFQNFTSTYYNSAGQAWKTANTQGNVYVDGQLVKSGVMFGYPEPNYSTSTFENGMIYIIKYGVDVNPSGKTVKLVIDPNNGMVETNENNNTFEGTVQ